MVMSDNENDTLFLVSGKLLNNVFFGASIRSIFRLLDAQKHMEGLDASQPLVADDDVARAIANCRSRCSTSLTFSATLLTSSTRPTAR